MKRSKADIEREIEYSRKQLNYQVEAHREIQAIIYDHVDTINELKRELYLLEGSRYANGQRMFSDDGTMLDANGNRSIFDDLDE